MMLRLNRFLAPIIAIALFPGMGCQSNPAALDPFTSYGNQRIPPPPTGSIGRNSGYYDAETARREASPAPMQPIPSLSNQTPEPGGTRTSSRESNLGDKDQNLESAKAPGPDFGASNEVNPRRRTMTDRNPIRQATADIEAPSGHLRLAHNLAWIPPFRNSHAIPPTAGAVSETQSVARSFANTPIPSRVAALSEETPLQMTYASPVRPAAVRPGIGSDVPREANPLEPLPLAQQGNQLRWQ